jgi:hypothetical protein
MLAVIFSKFKISKFKMLAVIFSKFKMLAVMLATIFSKFEFEFTFKKLKF